MLKLFFIVKCSLVCSVFSSITYNGTSYYGVFQQTSETLYARRNAIEYLRSQLDSMMETIPRREQRSVYLGNLPNSFSLVKRLTKVWPSLIHLTKVVFGKEIKVATIPFNTTTLWSSALTGLVRLQETYNIPTEALADGKLEDTYANTQLAGEDCFDIGVFYFHHLRHPSRANEWFKSALRKSKEDRSVSSTKTMEYLYLSQCFIGDKRGAILTLMKIIEKNRPFHPSAGLEVEYSYIANSTCGEISLKMAKSLYVSFKAVHNVKSQRGLCQAKPHQPSSDRLLRCRLLDYGHPHLRFRPFKMEELLLDPPVLMFHDVIHDNEIETLKNRYHNETRYAIADLGSYSSFEDPHQDTRNNIWLYTGFDGLVDEFNRKSKEITNFDVSRLDPLKFSSYGIAGEIKLHYDLVSQEMLLGPDSGPDYATLIFYLNDVPEGGYTIFPLLSLAVAPAKGNALLFFNRHPDMEANAPKMVHSGCPVLRGNKWILTKWFNVIGQDFPKCVKGKEKSFKYYYL